MLICVVKKLSSRPSLAVWPKALRGGTVQEAVWCQFPKFWSHALLSAALWYIHSALQVINANSTLNWNQEWLENEDSARKCLFIDLPIRLHIKLRADSETNPALTPLTLCHCWPLSSCSWFIFISTTQEISACLHIEIFSLLSLVVA